MSGSIWDIDDAQEEEAIAAIDNNNPYLKDPSMGIKLISLLLPKNKQDLEKKKQINLLNNIFEKKIWKTLNFVESSEKLSEENITKLIKQIAEYEKIKLLMGKSIVGLGGKFSAGKSGFINSIMDSSNNEVQLPEDQNPTTSIPTYIISGNEEKIEAYCDNRIVALDKNAMQAMTHEFYKKYNIGFSRFTNNIVIYTPSLPAQLFEKIVLLDTPGYNKPDEESRNSLTDLSLAIEQLNIVDYIIWLIDIENGTIHAEDLNFLRNIENNNPILFVFNKADKQTESQIKDTLSKAKKTIEDSGFKVFDVIAYSSRERKEYMSHNSIQKFFQMVSLNKLRKNDLNKEVDELTNIVSKILNQRILDLKEKRKYFSQVINSTNEILDIRFLSKVYGSVCSEIKELEKENRRFSYLQKDIKSSLCKLGVAN